MPLEDNNKTLIVDVFDAVFKRNGKTVFYSEDLTSTNLVNKVDYSEVNTGKGNKLFAKLPKGRGVTVELNTPVFSFATVAMQSGADIVTGAGIAYRKIDNIKVTTAGEITLPFTPLFPTDVEVMNIDTGVAIAGTITGKVFTATAPTDLALKQVVKVMPYKYETPATASTITVDAETYAEGGELILTTYEKSNDNKIVADIIITCPHVIPDGSWELQTQSEVQPKDMKINMSVLADKEDNYYTIQRIPR